MRLPFGYQIVKQTVTPTHLHVVVQVDPKYIADLVKKELLLQAKRNPARLG